MPSEKKRTAADAAPFVQELVQRREAAGLKRAPAARLAGIAQTHWNQVENGYIQHRGGRHDYPPSEEFVVKAARLFDWDLADALEKAGLDPARAPILEEHHPPRKELDVLLEEAQSLLPALRPNQLLAAVYMMRVMVNPNAVVDIAKDQVALAPRFVEPSKSAHRSRT
ncbi:helix-turn-helix transcriptional regulator [Amycolatopsis sp. NPDC006131]|uniref:helix-turn-helix domain-containing protein n=1 Tax=Amycolatopsis sp. NPDC006131 TaxID=3156731 RepID=UPI0033A12E1D